MDGNRFDVWARVIGSGRSRRSVLRGIGAVALGAVGMARAGTARAACDTEGCSVCQECNFTTGFCDPAPDGTSCDDGDLCTENDFCLSGSCSPGQTVTCGGDACTYSYCDSFSGCVYTPVICDDGDPCTNDYCDPSFGCYSEPVICTNADACTLGYCDPLTGGCAYYSVDCDDFNLCTIDSCDPSSGCSYEAVICDDGNPCTDDYCDSTIGCVYNPLPDGTLCDGGVCTNGSCGPVDLCVGVECTPLDQCHEAGICDPATGTCSNPMKPNGAACNDGNACTQTDTCQAGVCVGGNSVVCAPLDQCHAAGTCNPATGVCSVPPLTAATCKSGRIKSAVCDCDGTCCGAGNNCVGKPGQRRCQ